MSSPPTNANVDRFKVEELEMENKKLREHLDRLRAAGDSVLVSKNMSLSVSGIRISKTLYMDAPLSRSNFYYCRKQTQSLASSNYGSDVDIINEDGELATAYEAQKDINRQLQEELLAEKKFYSEHISKLLSTELSEQPKTKSQEFAQNEIIRLAAESLALQNQIRLLVQKLREVGVEDVNDILEHNDRQTIGELSPVQEPDTTARPETERSLCRRRQRHLRTQRCRRYKNQIRLLVQKLREVGVEDVNDILEHNVGLLPGLPAYILFMMLRHTDHVDDEPKMHLLMKAVRTGVKKTLKKRTDSVEYN
ncbi:Dilute class unconventional myosin, partial [Operophtera brumata]